MTHESTGEMATAYELLMESREALQHHLDESIATQTAGLKEIRACLAAVDARLAELEALPKNVTATVATVLKDESRRAVDAKTGQDLAPSVRELQALVLAAREDDAKRKAALREEDEKRKARARMTKWKVGAAAVCLLAMWCWGYAVGSKSSASDATNQATQTPVENERPQTPQPQRRAKPNPSTPRAGVHYPDTTQ
jgi:hypothetical protein